MTLTVIMAKGSGREIVTRHPTKTSALEACLDPVQEALLFSSVYTSGTWRLEKSSLLPKVSQLVTRQAGSRSPERTPLSIILSGLDPGA